MEEKDLNGNVVVRLYPFPSKTADGCKLFQRLHGNKAAVTTGSNTIDFVIPYAKAKIDGMDVVGAEVGEQADMIVLDTSQGHIQLSMGVPAENVVPNAPLNQFGFGVGMFPGSHAVISKYDADLIQGMVIRVVYTALSNKDIVFNYYLHECVAP